MLLSDHDLLQIDDEYIESLSSLGSVKEVAKRLCHDLKEARDRLNQTPNNSSCPPSSRKPWDTGGLAGFPDDDASKGHADELEVSTSPKCDKNAPDKMGRGQKKSPRNPGKQPGTQGFGRTQILKLTSEVVHKANVCSACGSVFEEDAEFVACNGHYMIDILWGDPLNPGIQLTNAKHTFGDTLCSCGHKTSTLPSRSERLSYWNVDLTEWRLIGPDLASLIASLTMRMRLSRPRVQELLSDWLGLQLSVGVINQCVHESGRAVEPLENQMIEELNSSELLGVDETPWKERARLLWLWVFSTATVVYYAIGYRSAEIIGNVLDESFSGKMMSDGYKVYRTFKERLRCWAHLLRKAHGLQESFNKEARSFGTKTLDILDVLMKAIYQARVCPGENLVEKHRDTLDQFRRWCEQYKNSGHKKTRELAGEFLNDWEAIFRILSCPHMPLTNNEAERALRHWVILRKLSYGTRTEQGSRVFALLASVIETCRKRGVLPWPYLAKVIAARRKGLPVPPLPTAA